jgi:4'-phosphopantetheinyl transferase EntD
LKPFEFQKFFEAMRLTLYKTPTLFHGTHIAYVSIEEMQGMKIELPQGLLDAHSAKKAAFFAGRLCAKESCEKLGVLDAIVGQETSGRPQFPPGFVGSISHSAKYAFSIAGKETDWYSLGIDVEKTDTSARKLEAIEKKILTSSERKKWEGNTHAILAIFTLKEAAFKCVNWIRPCRTNSFEVLELEEDRIEICMRERGHDLSLLAYTELSTALEHCVSMVGILANFSPNRACK